MAKERKPKINKRRLVRELLVIGGVALVIFLVRFIPWLVEQPIPGYDPYAKYETLVHEVENYDYSKGGDKDLEKRLENATASVGSSPIQYFYNLKAKAIYYNRIGFFDISNEVVDEAMRSVPNAEEKMAMYGMYIDNYRALGNEEKVLEYEAYYNDIKIIVGE